MVESLPSAGPFVLDGPEGRHASVVRRMRIGEAMVLTSGDGRLAVATVTAVAKGSVQVLVGPVTLVAPPPVIVTLVQALPKGERSELAVDLATEAGVDALVPWAASRCVARWTPAEKAAKGVQRWQTIAREAAKQSRRAVVPAVASMASTADVAGLIAESAGALVLHEAGSVLITDAVLPSAGNLLLVVGPEGGISPQEIDTFRAAGAQVVRLGPEVLRTSTAAAVALGALGVLSHRWV
ncbi:16S rRNA (uracil(1498)-N(3))-methyltransferase [Nakamurella sp. UYEF19]|uniref:16S rRNA (uracil(1498)-N(3))-methyltransferase n=1 Tax=Nakamurella sp. UYEF19 TaxID=1756392 RepID=UPI00339677F5